MMTSSSPPLPDLLEMDENDENQPSGTAPRSDQDADDSWELFSAQDAEDPAEKAARMEGLLRPLLDYFAVKQFSAANEDPRIKLALEQCLTYFAKDYYLAIIENKKGVLSPHYPAIIPFIENVKVRIRDGQLQTIPERGSSLNMNNLQTLLTKSSEARCRSRFPVPVLMYKNKFIFRGATVSGIAEVVYKKVQGNVTKLIDTLSLLPSYVWKPQSGNPQPEDDPESTDDQEDVFNLNLLSLMNCNQEADRALLSQFDVVSIIDLMVEYRKVKYGLPVTSSEKCETNGAYKDAVIISLPYPGCEFFKDFHNNAFKADGLKFDWTQSMCTAELKLPAQPRIQAHLGIDFSQYKEWDLLQLTSNYMRYILSYLHKQKHGVLIHCISGWDRTPLFVSLLRLSLWADNLAHPSLDEGDILFLTLCYDWMLFGHNLNDRLYKNEDILMFCFYFLKYLASDEFSLAPSRKRKSSGRSGVPLMDRRRDGNARTPTPTESESSKASGSGSGSGDGSETNLLLEDTGSDSQSPKREGGRPRSGMSMGSEKSLSSESLDGAGSPPSSAKSAPVVIPNTKSEHDSDSTGTGSWTFVAETGSVSSRGANECPLKHASCDSDCPIIIMRRKRLLGVRLMFYKVYFKIIKNIDYTKKKGLYEKLADIVQSYLPKGADADENQCA